MLSSRDLHAVIVFAAVVRHASFTAAARELRLTKSVVSGHVRALEERLGARLLERTTRRMRLTQVGEQVYASAQRMIAAAGEIQSATESHRTAPTGTLRVAATTDLGHRLVSPCVVRLCKQYPQLDVEALFDDREIDVIAAGVEVTLRVGVPKDSRLVAKKLVDDEEIIVASPELARELQHAKRPRDLASAPWLGHAEVRPVRQTFHGPRGHTDELVVRRHRAIASTTAALRALAREGVGLLVLPRVLLEEELIDGSLVRVLSPWRRRVVGLYVVMPSRAHVPSRVSAFIECVTDAVTKDADTATPGRRLPRRPET